MLGHISILTPKCILNAWSQNPFCNLDHITYNIRPNLNSEYTASVSDTDTSVVTAGIMPSNTLLHQICSCDSPND